MKIDLMMLETYLDGELSAEQKAAVDQAIAQDASVGQTLRSLRSHRALRGAALQTYRPQESEADALTAAVLDAASAPIGRVGGGLVWVRRLSGVAAMIVLTAGGFVYGRHSAPAKTVIQDHYMVAIITPSGELTEHTFTSKDDENKFVAEVQQLGDGTKIAGVF